MNKQNQTPRITFFGILLILLLSPVPLASNRPVFWLIWGCFIFTLAGLQCLNYPDQRLPDQILPRFFWLLLAILMVFIATQVFYPLSIAPRASSLALLRMASYIIYFWLVLTCCTNANTRMVLLTSCFVILLYHSVIALLLYVNVFDLPLVFAKSDYPDSLTGTFVNRNSFATYLGMGLLTGVALLEIHLGKIRQPVASILDYLTPGRAFILCGIIIFTVTLFLTNSRFGLVASGLGLITFICLNSWKNHVSARNWLLPMLLMAIFITVAFGFQRFSGFRISALSHDISTRLTLYEQVWSMIQNQPWSGFGADSFPVAFPRFHLPTLDPDLVWDKAHNSFLTNWAELGLVFGSIPIIAGLIVMRALFRSAQTATENRHMALLAIAVLVQTASHSLVDFSLEIQANVFVILTIIALGLHTPPQAEADKMSW